MYNKKIPLDFLPKEYRMVENPDNPFTYDVPNYLLGNKGNLYGLFIPSKIEILDLNRLLRRLANSRLSFPSHLKNILIVFEDDFLNNNYKILQNNFHVICPSLELSGLAKILRTEIKNNYVEDVNQQIRRKVFQRHSSLYLLCSNYIFNESRSYKKIELREKYNTIIGWESGQVTRSPINNVFKLNNLLLYSKQVNVNKSFTFNFDNALTFSSQFDYNLDNGVPIPSLNNFESITKFINIDKLPINPYDPLKFIRALTFSGWFPVTASEFYEIEKINLEIETQKELNHAKKKYSNK